MRNVGNKLKNDINYECLLISGAWGLGKTRYYEDNYQDNGALPDIYISCFSATKNDLLARIINQNWLWKILLLNGILVKLFENNWQQFMPENRTIVLDDLERLHSEDENYLDIIGIIDFLKLNKKCKVILIADISKIPQIFNTYLERIVDDVAIWQPCEIKDLLHDSSYTDFTKQMANYLTYHHSNCGEHLSNRRIIKNILKQINNWSNNNTLLNNKDSLTVSIFLGLIAPQINTLIKLRYVYFYDYQWFCSLVHEIHDKHMYMKICNKTKPHASCTDSNYQRNIEMFFYGKTTIQSVQTTPIGGFSFGVHYLEVKDQEKCRIYKINDYDIDIIVKIYTTCVNKDNQQLEREWQTRLSTGAYNNNIFIFNLTSILNNVLEKITDNHVISSIFSLENSMAHFLTERVGKNFHRPSKFWHIEDNNQYQNIFHPSKPQEYANNWSNNQKIYENIQDYKNQLIQRFLPAFNYLHFLEIIEKNPDAIFMILGILYNINQELYNAMIFKFNSMITVKEYLINKDGWLKEHDKLWFCSGNINVTLWLFEPNIDNLQDKINKTYETIIQDMNLTDQESDK